jgi:hypothetical protein
VAQQRAIDWLATSAAFTGARAQNRQLQKRVCVAWATLAAWTITVAVIASAAMPAVPQDVTCASSQALDSTLAGLAWLSGWSSLSGVTRVSAACAGCAAAAAAVTAPTPTPQSYSKCQAALRSGLAASVGGCRRVHPCGPCGMTKSARRRPRLQAAAAPPRGATPTLRHARLEAHWRVDDPRIDPQQLMAACACACVCVRRQLAPAQRGSPSSPSGAVCAVRQHRLRWGYCVCAQPMCTHPSGQCGHTPGDHQRRRSRVRHHCP